MTTPDVYRTSDYRALFKGCAEWWDYWGMLSDLLRDAVDEFVAQEAQFPAAFLTPWDIWSFGSGSGSGRGSGIGSGSGIINYEVRQMEIGQCYLIFCGDWRAFVGRVVAQVGPFTYRLEQVSKIAETNNGDNWELLAKGDSAARNAASYKHYSTPFVLPLTIAATEWAGKLPQEK